MGEKRAGSDGEGREVGEKGREVGDKWREVREKWREVGGQRRRKSFIN